MLPLKKEVKNTRRLLDLAGWKDHERTYRGERQFGVREGPEGPWLAGGQELVKHVLVKVKKKPNKVFEND